MRLEPMLRLIAGTFVAASVILALTVHPYFFALTLFVAANLIQSSVSGWCPMMTMLRRLGVRDA